MKLQRLFMLGSMALAIGLIASCSGEDGTNGTNGTNGADGATGPAGAAGADGADGVNGADGIACWDLNGNGVGDFEEDINGDELIDALDCQGTDGDDGADGNANVQRLIIDTTSWEEGYNPAEVSGITQLSDEVLENYAILTYLVSPDIGLYAPIPARININGLRNFNVGFSTETVVITETAGAGWSNAISELHLILIEQNGSTTIDGGGGNKGQVHDIKTALKAAEVDINNYHEVVKYLGIE